MKLPVEEKENRKRLKDFYGECFISGDSLYGMNEVKDDGVGLLVKQRELPVLELARGYIYEHLINK